MLRLVLAVVAACIAAVAAVAQDTEAPAEIRLESIRNETNLATLSFIGGVQTGDSERLRLAIKDLVNSGFYVEAINLFSPGGNAVEGLSLGRVINEFYLTTNAPRRRSDGRFRCIGFEQIMGSPILPPESEFCICASACAMAWLGGVERYGEVGFHSIYLPNTTIGRDQARLVRADLDILVQPYLEHVGAPDFVGPLIDDTGAQDLQYPDATQKEVLELNRDHRMVVTGACTNELMPKVLRMELRAMLDKMVSEVHVGQSPWTEAEASRMRILLELKTEESRCLRRVRLAALAINQSRLADGLPPPLQVNQ